ncbi:MAG TPA: hypothetical protein VGM09_14145 [Bradyrhizobium sp.]|jgi:hypothetical protein
MPDRTFYVKSLKDKKFTGYVPAQFLMRNGAYVMNPTPGGSQRETIYSDLWGNNGTSGREANPNNYLIVPANYTEQKARDFANRIAKGGRIGAGLEMANAFTQGGSQDLQRHPQWGIPKGSAVKAFVGGASNHLGFVTGYAGVPKEWSQIGGGVANTINGDVVQPGRKLFGYKATDIDTSGPYGLSRQNDSNISQGYADGVAARKTPAPFDAARTLPAPFDDYGYNPQPERRAGQIGDGRGIAGLIAALPGIDPQEPTPPVWPLPADRPIRYLGRVR